MTDPSKPQADTLTTGILLSDFERSLRAAHRSPATITHYLGATRQFLAFTDAASIEDVERGDIEAWLVSLQEHYKPATALNRYKGLAAFFRWLTEEEELPRNPMARVRPPSAPETQKDIVSPDNMRRMFALLEREKRWRDASMLATLYDTGMRAGELAALFVEDLDRDSGIITLRAETTKARRERVVRVSPPTLVYIDRYLRRRKPRTKADARWLILGTKGRMTPNGIYQVVQSCFAEIGLATISPHDLRHTSASHSAGEMSEGALLTLYGWQSQKMARLYTRQRLREVALAEHTRHSPMERLGR